MCTRKRACSSLTTCAPAVSCLNPPAVWFWGLPTVPALLSLVGRFFGSLRVRTFTHARSLLLRSTRSLLLESACSLVLGSARSFEPSGKMPGRVLPFCWQLWQDSPLVLPFCWQCGQDSWPRAPHPNQPGALGTGPGRGEGLNADQDYPLPSPRLCRAGVAGTPCWRAWGTVARWPDACARAGVVRRSLALCMGYMQNFKVCTQYAYILRCRHACARAHVFIDIARVYNASMPHARHETSPCTTLCMLYFRSRS